MLDVFALYGNRHLWRSELRIGYYYIQSDNVVQLEVHYKGIPGALAHPVLTVDCLVTYTLTHTHVYIYIYYLFVLFGFIF